jgi:hypothetical protein
VQFYVLSICYDYQRSINYYWDLLSNKKNIRFNNQENEKAIRLKNLFNKLTNKNDDDDKNKKEENDDQSKKEKKNNIKIFILISNSTPLI